MFLWGKVHTVKQVKTRADVLVEFTLLKQVRTNKTNGTGPSYLHRNETQLGLRPNDFVSK